MTQSPGHDNSRREFLGATVTGAFGVSAGWLTRPTAIAASDIDARTSPGELSVMSARSIAKESTEDLHLRFVANDTLREGAKLWLFFDIRQDAGMMQTTEPGGANYLTVTVDGEELADDAVEAASTRNWGIRTFDLLPATPEFLHLIEVTLDRGVSTGTPVDFVVKRWTAPQQPIDPFQFWLVVDADAAWKFEPIDFRRYRRFVTRADATRVSSEKLLAHMATASLQVTGEHRPVPAVNHRQTPGIFWGEFHGMVFNQRPLDDYYNYARNVTRLDFCAPMWFSYNTCIGEVWDEVKAASRRHTEPGEFVALAAFECGTPPDGSHRCVLFRDPEGVPPIFCEDRPPAVEPVFQERFHPDTIVCKTVEELYEAVAEYDGMITGHFHTLQYHAEVLCEMFQKNLVNPGDEEERLYGLLREGKRFGLAGTSDTHDSMPGNPLPEPHLPMAAGFTGAPADELTAPALLEAGIEEAERLVGVDSFAMHFHCGGQPMGAELQLDTKRKFQIEIDGTAKLRTVELLRDGVPIKTWNPDQAEFSVTALDAEADRSKAAYYLVRVTQEDDHQGWTSPIWIG